MYMTRKIAMSRQWSSRFQASQPTIASASGGTAVITRRDRPIHVHEDGLADLLGRSDRQRCLDRPTGRRRVEPPHPREPAPRYSATGPAGAAMLTILTAPSAARHCGRPPEGGGSPPGQRGG